MVVCAIFAEALRTLLQTIPRDLAQVNGLFCSELAWVWESIASGLVINLHDGERV